MLPRLIPILGISDGRLVKTVRFSKPNYLGDPLNAIRIFNDKMVDEIAIVDIRASKENTEIDYQIIEEMASECFSPLSYGGGIQNFEQAKKVFDLGVEKLILNSSAFSNPELIKSIADSYGSQSVVVSLDVKKDFWGKSKLYASSGSKKIKGNIIEKIKYFQELGAGEFILQDVDRDGTFKGANCDLIKELSNSIKVPLVYLGGVNSLDDIKQALNSGAQAVAAGSFFAYNNNNTDSVLIQYPEYQLIKKELT